MPRQLGVVTPLDGFTGTMPPPPTGADVFEPLDGAVGGSLLWTASYEASTNRFALHDALGDLDALRPGAPQGFHGNQAVYVVAGWFTDLADDPLDAATSMLALDAALADLGWFVTHDSSGQASYEALDGETALGLPVASPPDQPTIAVQSAFGSTVAELHGIGLTDARVVSDVAGVVLAPDEPKHSCLFHGAVLGVPLKSATGADDRPAADAIGVAIGIDTDDVVAALAAPTLGLGAGAQGAAERLVAAFTGEMLDRFRSRHATPPGTTGRARLEDCS